MKNSWKINFGINTKNFTCAKKHLFLHKELEEMTIKKTSHFPNSFSHLNLIALLYVSFVVMFLFLFLSLFPFYPSCSSTSSYYYNMAIIVNVFKLPSHKSNYLWIWIIYAWHILIKCQVFALKPFSRQSKCWLLVWRESCSGDV